MIDNDLLREMLLAMEYIDQEYSPSNAGEDGLPKMYAFWQANRERAQWLVARELHPSFPEPPPLKVPFDAQ